MATATGKMTAVILAAGEGTRMKSARSKVLHEIFGKSLIEYVVEAAKRAGVGRIVIVAGKNMAELKNHFGKSAEIVLQPKRLGTGHALMCAAPALKNFRGHLLVMAGDAPLIRPETLKEFAALHRETGAAASILTAKLSNPKGYGRILRDYDGTVTGIREELEASDDEKDINEVNSSIYFFDAAEVLKALKTLKPSREKKEYYLTDAIETFVKEGKRVDGYPLAQAEELLGVNTRKHLADAARVVWMRNIDYHLERGVTVVSPENTYIEEGVQIGEDTVIHPFTYIEKGVKIGPNCEVGPFCKLRSGTTVKKGAVIGSFVEIVRSTIGEKTMVKHLTYLGDAQVGSRVNIGAGTITANYDGRNKNKTRIGDGAFIGSDTVAIAPVSIGSRAKTGAGSVITSGKNVPAGAIAFGVPARIIRKKS